MTLLEIDVEVPDLASVEIETPDVELTPSSGETVLLVVTPGPPGIQGPPGQGTPVFGETPAGVINGANTVFTTSQAYLASTTAVYLNGLREFHYTETSSTTITLSDAPHTGDAVRIDYLVA